MINIRYNKEDLRYIFLYGDNKEISSLEAHLNKIPSYQFLPSFSGIPKPEVFLNKFKKDNRVIYYCFSGLWKEIVDFCNKEKIQVDGIDSYFKYREFPLSLEEFTEYVNKWNLNLQPRDYQIKAAWLILKYRVSLSQLATRAGKTLIAYMTFRYMLENGAHNILMVVPNTTLVKQGVKDMSEYQEFFKSETVWAGGELCDSSNLTIGTFQSLVKRANKKDKKYDPKFFNKFDVVCVDEAHTAKCKSIKMILNQDFLKNVKLRFGFSGSLPEPNSIDSFACQSLIGPMIQDISSKELVDEGFLAKPEITQVRIKYDWSPQLEKAYIRCGEYLCSIDVMEEYTKRDGRKDKRAKLLPKEQQEFTIKNEKKLPLTLAKVKPLYEPREYISYLIDLCKAKGSNLLMLEQMLVHRSQKRLDIMDQLIISFNKNVLVFGHHTEYLIYLAEHFEKRFPDKKIYLIIGKTNIKKREKTINELLKNNNCILVASYGCVGTGLTLKNMDYCIFAQSFKSQVINKQALGRMMLKTSEKDTFELYDLIDEFPTKRLYTQGLAKIKIYKKEGIEHRIVMK